MRLLVTGGAGFIGSAVVRKAIGEMGDEVVVLDKLTYAGNLSSLAPAARSPRYSFVRADICDRGAVRAVEAMTRHLRRTHAIYQALTARQPSGPGRPAAKGRRASRPRA